MTARRPSPHASRRSGSSRRVIAPLAALALALSACTSTSGATDSVSPSSRGVTGSPGSPAGTASTPSPAPSSTGPATPATTTQAETGASAGAPTGVARPIAGTVAGTVVTDLNTPWGVGFLPDGNAVVTGRDDAAVTLVTADGSKTELGTIPGVEPGGEGGLLGIAVSPRFAQDALLYLYFTAADDNRVVTVDYRDGRLGEPRVILDGIPKAGTHDGGRMVFGPDGLLYIGTGDAQNRDGAQDLGYLGGKILRVAPDGSPAPGNPFPDQPLIYSFGHRNVQGLAFAPDGALWSAEFGQNTWDELNLIEPGANYGWPEVEGPDDSGRFTAPVKVWATDDASPSGIAVADGAVFMASLNGERLWRIPIDGAGAADPIELFTGEYGRLRTVVLAPDGSLWLTTSNTDGRGDDRDGDDRILRVT